MRQRRVREEWHRAWRAARRRWALWLVAAAALAALAAAARAARPALCDHAAAFPAARAHHLAHLLADISADAHSIPGSWSLEEESGNYSSWRYAVSYSCGARCAGRAWVHAQAGAEAGADAGLRHGPAARHRVLVRTEHCSTLPLLPWPPLCEEVETESWVWAEAGAGGARLRERWAARCGASAALLGACPAAADLCARAAARRRRLAALLPAASSAAVAHH